MARAQTRSARSARIRTRTRTRSRTGGPGRARKTTRTTRVRTGMMVNRTTGAVRRVAKRLTRVASKSLGATPRRTTRTRKVSRA